MAEKMARGTGRRVSCCHPAPARGAASMRGETARAGSTVGAKSQTEAGTSFSSPRACVGPQGESISQNTVRWPSPSPESRTRVGNKGNFPLTLLIGSDCTESGV